MIFGHKIIICFGRIRVGLEFVSGINRFEMGDDLHSGFKIIDSTRLSKMCGQKSK